MLLHCWCVHGVTVCVLVFCIMLPIVLARRLATSGCNPMLQLLQLFTGALCVRCIWRRLGDGCYHKLLLSGWCRRTAGMRRGGYLGGGCAPGCGGMRMAISAQPQAWNS